MSDQDSKKQILKSTGLLGSVQLVNIIVGIVRVKFLAILLGPVGVGISGIYQTTISLISSATGFGIGFSGVRDIASAAAMGDENKVARTYTTIYRWAWATGILGALIAIFFSRPLSKFAFGDESYTWGIRILSIGILTGAVATAYGVLLQGLRRLGDMAKANIIGSLAGLFSAVVIYFFLGFKGIVPALLAGFLINFLISWYYAGKIIKRSIEIVSYKQSAIEGISMVRLGFFTVVSSFALNGTLYVVRAFILRQDDISAVGNFTAAWTISTMYISAVLGAMGADFFPRLSGIHSDNAAVKKLVNEQTEIAMLITAPIIIGMLTTVDIIVRLFYSKQFDSTGQILSWQIAGDFFKILSWPMGFILLAKGKGGTFVATELSWCLFYFFGVYILWDIVGLESTGIAFLVSYVFYLLSLLFVTKKIAGFSWSIRVKKYFIFYFLLIALVFLSSQFLEGLIKYLAGGLVFLIASFSSLYQLRKIIDFKSIIQYLVKR